MYIKPNSKKQNQEKEEKVVEKTTDNPAEKTKEPEKKETGKVINSYKFMSKNILPP